MRYVLVMLGSLVGLVIVAYLLLYLLISVGCIYPANYAEQKINEAYDTILRADKVTAEMIPALCDYVIFSENGEKIGGDLSEQYEQIAWNVAKYGNASGKYFYKVIVRENDVEEKPDHHHSSGGISRSGRLSKLFGYETR